MLRNLKDVKRPEPAAAGTPSSPQPGAAARPREPISLRFRDAAALQSAYMPFISNGGIFLPAVRGFELGDVVELKITLPGDVESVTAIGKVCWITPAGVPGRPEGVGVQFDPGPDGEALKARIDTMIASRIDPSLRSNTL